LNDGAFAFTPSPGWPALVSRRGRFGFASGRAADSGWSGASGFALRRATPFLSIIFIFN